MGGRPGGWPRWAGGWPGWAGGWPGTAGVATAVTLLNWPLWQVAVPGLDTSWQAGIAVAFTRHMQWGPAVDFTYGPYGFAGFVQPLYRSTAMIAIAYVFVVTWVLSALLVATARTWLVGRRGSLSIAKSLVLAGALAWAVVAVSWAVGRAADFANVVGLGLALRALALPAGRLRTALVIVLGALAGFSLLVKLNTGIVLVGLLVLALAGAAPDLPGRRWRLPAASVGVLAGSFSGSWAAGGQSFGHLYAFGRASLSLALGYSSAMAGPLPAAGVAWWALGVGVVALATVTTGWRGRPRRQQVAGGLMFAGWWWAIVKEGFVAGNHFPGFFRVALAAIAVAGVWHGRAIASAAMTAIAMAAALLVAGTPPVHPLASLQGVFSELSDIARPGHFLRMTAAARARVLREERLSPGALRLLGHRTTAIEPWEDMVAWAAPEIRWDPEPVLQSYSAYTSSLDAIDAAFLASSAAPQMVIYRPFSFDHRDRAADPPATMEALYCHYVQIAVSGPWQVLQRAADRCGRPRALLSVLAHFGEWARVPVAAAGEMVVARFYLGSPVQARIEGALLKAPSTYIKLQDGKTSVRYRFVTGTAADAHVLSVPPALRYSPRFTPRHAGRIELSGGGWATGQGTVRVTFQAVPMAR